MDCADCKEQMTLLLTDSLDEFRRGQLERHLESCPDCEAEFEASRKIWNLMGEIPNPAPPASIRARFNIALSNYIEDAKTDEERPSIANVLRRRWLSRPQLQLGFGILLLGVGFLAGSLLNRPAKMQTPFQTHESTGAVTAAGLKAPPQTPGSIQEQKPPPEQHSSQGDVPYSRKIDSLSSQVSEMKQLVMLSLLENPSASQRIRAVGYTSEIGNANKKVIDALFTTLNEDPNVNVRLFTLDALTKFSKDPGVRQGLVQSITQQESPLLQSAIADVMVKLQEKRSVQPLQKLLLKKDLNETVKLKIEQSIRKLI